jgi:hypothetical protein
MPQAENHTPKSAPLASTVNYDLFSEIVRPDGARETVVIGSASYTISNPKDWLFQFDHFPLSGSVWATLQAK